LSNPILRQEAKNTTRPMWRPCQRPAARFWWQTVVPETTSNSARRPATGHWSSRTQSLVGGQSGWPHAALERTIHLMTFSIQCKCTPAHQSQSQFQSQSQLDTRRAHTQTPPADLRGSIWAGQFLSGGKLEQIYHLSVGPLGPVVVAAALVSRGDCLPPCVALIWALRVAPLPVSIWQIWAPKSLQQTPPSAPTDRSARD